MLMGLNAVFCKPMDSVLPILAAHWLHVSTSGLKEEDNENMKKAMFQLLVAPPVVLCIVQMWSWSKYTLTPDAMAAIEAQLAQLRATPATSITTTSITTTTTTGTTKMEADAKEEQGTKLLLFV
ncbi:hypothetical protein H257_11946 [Aphanomyces astaci]|nr:hypothetical protein H257_11946 [Aphanomyces astaci]ETV73124.1 hypothetical protein H257_11946 [Aphanomyces astaci]|eukprot:XP_009837329.1 hypothetical protein H257_11946 [Aphanomyces astaci]